MLLYQERIRAMNEMVLIEETPVSMVNRLEAMDVEFDEGLDKNLNNIYRNMMLRNAHIKDTIDTYSRDYH